MAAPMIVSARDLAREYMLTIAQINLLLSGSNANHCQTEGEHHEMQVQFGRLLTAPPTCRVIRPTTITSTATPAFHAAPSNESKVLPMGMNTNASGHISLCDHIMHSTKEHARAAANLNTKLVPAILPHDAQQPVEVTPSSHAEVGAPCASTGSNIRTAEAAVSSNTHFLVPCHSVESSNVDDIARMIHDSTVQGTQTFITESQKSIQLGTQAFDTEIPHFVIQDQQIAATDDVNVCSNPYPEPTHVDTLTNDAAATMTTAAFYANSNNTTSEDVLTIDNNILIDSIACHNHTSGYHDCTAKNSTKLMADSADCTDLSTQEMAACSYSEPQNPEPRVLDSCVLHACCNVAQQLPSNFVDIPRYAFEECMAMQVHQPAMAATICADRDGGLNQTASTRPSHLLSGLPQLKVDRNTLTTYAISNQQIDAMYQSPVQGSIVGEEATSRLTSMLQDSTQNANTHCTDGFPVSSHETPDLQLPQLSSPQHVVLSNAISSNAIYTQGMEPQIDGLPLNALVADNETALRDGQAKTEKGVFHDDRGVISTGQQHVDASSPLLSHLSAYMASTALGVSDTHTEEAALDKQLKVTVGDYDMTHAVPDGITETPIADHTVGECCEPLTIPPCTAQPCDFKNNDSSLSNSSTPSATIDMHADARAYQSELAFRSSASFIQSSDLGIAVSQAASPSATQHITQALSNDNDSEPCMSNALSTSNEDEFVGTVEGKTSTTWRPRAVGLSPTSPRKMLTICTELETSSTCSSSDDDPCRWISRAALMGRPLQNLPSSSSDEEVECRRQCCSVSNNCRQQRPAQLTIDADMQQSQVSLWPAVRHANLGCMTVACCQGKGPQHDFEQTPHVTTVPCPHEGKLLCHRGTTASPAYTDVPATTALQQLVIGTHSIAQAAATAAQCLPLQASTGHVRTVRRHVFMALDHLSQALGAIAEAHSHATKQCYLGGLSQHTNASGSGMLCDRHASSHSQQRGCDVACMPRETFQSVNLLNKTSTADSCSSVEAKQNSDPPLSECGNHKIGDKAAVIKAPAPLQGVLLELSNGAYRLVTLSRDA